MSAHVVIKISTPSSAFWKVIHTLSFPATERSLVTLHRPTALPGPTAPFLGAGLAPFLFRSEKAVPSFLCERVLSVDEEPHCHFRIIWR